MSRSAELHAVGVICSMLRLTDKSSMMKVVFWLFFQICRGFFCCGLHSRGVRCFCRYYLMEKEEQSLRTFNSVLCSGEKKALVCHSWFYQFSLKPDLLALFFPITLSYSVFLILNNKYVVCRETTIQTFTCWDMFLLNLCELMSVMQFTDLFKKIV